MKFNIFLIVVLSVFLSKVSAQQDPHYTQYMYNTMSINSAYAGSKDHAFLSALARTQWLGLEGAPNTQNVSFDASVGKGVGLGINIVNDVLGPSRKISIDGNISYTIEMSSENKLAFGLRLGGQMLDVDWSRGTRYQQFDPVYKENVYKVSPIIGSGIYYCAPEKWYIGFSVPNLLRNDSYDGKVGFSTDKMHLYTILGYVFSVAEDIKFKPASLIKAVSGAPLSIDFSANFYFYEKFNAGLSYRWGDSVSALLGFQITDSLLVGYAYDLTTSNYSVSNTGTHEVLLQYHIFGVGGPRRLDCF